MQSVKNKANRLGLHKSGILKEDNNNNPKEDEMEKKTGIVDKYGDGSVIINYSTKTIVTDLGAYLGGSVLTSFSTHGAIQRYYVDGFGNRHTASETAMEFPIFTGAKAVIRYAHLHEFSKASLGQSDIEFEEGMTEEDAVKENLQAMKARIARKTELEKWKIIQNKADKWDTFHHSALMPLKDWMQGSMPKFKPVTYRPLMTREKTCAVLGLSDEHYLKKAWDYMGKETYNRKKAVVIINNAIRSLVTEVEKFGVPELMFVPSGSDSLHIDGIGKTTTAGTPQGRQTDGDWEIDMESYIDLRLSIYEMLAQVTNIVIVPMYGNHNNESAIMMHHFLMKFYEGRKGITVVKNHAPRVYQKYGKNAFIFQHGKSPGTAKFQREAHKYFLAEAKSQGINLHTAEHLSAFTGDLHHDSYKDLGGVKHFIIPSLAPADSWHDKEGFIGSREEASLYLFDKNKGRKAVLYS